MKAGFFSAIVGAFAVLSTNASAQVTQVDSTPPLSVGQDSAAVAMIPSAATEHGIVGVRYDRATSTALPAQESGEGGLKDFFFGTQRRKSNTLLIGGVALAGIGVGVVKGHPGAIMGIAGLLSCIAGMYYLF